MPFRASLFVFLILLATSVASAQERFALLIGNQGYAPEVGMLINPINDVHLVAQSLQQAGFAAGNIDIVTDADRRGILLSLDRYANRLARAGADAIGFFYYSGHGAARQRDNRNFLLPVDIPRMDDTAWYDAVALDTIIDKLSTRAPSAAHFVIFDACRNVLRTPTRGGKGFLPVTARRGMLIAFSTDPGQTASDAGDGSGPYAKALAAEISKPGQHHLDLFQNVKERVFKSTQTQVPWERNGLLTRVYLQSPGRPHAPRNTSPRRPTPRAADYSHDGNWLGEFCALRTPRSPKLCIEMTFKVDRGQLSGWKGRKGQPGYTNIVGKVSPEGNVSVTIDGVSKAKHRYGRPYHGRLTGKARAKSISATGKFDTGRGALIKLQRL